MVFSEVLLKKIKGQESMVTNSFIRRTITFLTEKRANNSKIIEVCTKRGFKSLNSSMTNDLNKNTKGNWTSLLKTGNENPVAELEVKLAEAKAMSLLVLKTLGYRSFVEKAKKDPKLLKTSFRLQGNGPTIETIFNNGEIKYSLDMTFFHSDKGNEQKVEPIRMVGLEAKSKTARTNFVLHRHISKPMHIVSIYIILCKW